MYVDLWLLSDDLDATSGGSFGRHYVRGPTSCIGNSVRARRLLRRNQVKVSADLLSIASGARGSFCGQLAMVNDGSSAKTVDREIENLGALLC